MTSLAPYLAGIGRSVAAGLVALICAAPAGANTQDAVAALSELDAQMADAAQSDATASFALMRPPVDPAFVQSIDALKAAPKAEVVLTDLRIILAQMSRSAGANNQLLVLRAQAAEQPKALTIKSGTLFLEDLKQIVQTQYPDAGLLDDTGFHAPIVVWSDATLVLPDTAQLDLNRSSGAFLASFGKLQISGASIAGVGAANPKVEAFRPFVAVLGTGWADIANGHFSNLGFGKTAAFSGVSVIGGGLFRAPEPSKVMNSVFENIGSLSVLGAESPIIENNAFLSATDIPLTLRKGTDAQITGNLFLSSEGKSALRLSEGIKNSTITRNTFLQGVGNGIELVGAGVQTKISDNMIWGHGGAGISIDRSDCVAITNNSILRSGKKGISLKTSRNAQVAQNQLFKGRSSAIQVSEQPEGAQTQIHNNLIVQNRIGLSLIGAADVALQGNDLTLQFPRLLEGDIAFQAGPLLQDLKGAEAIHLASTSLSLAGLEPMSCPSPQGEES